MDTEGSYISLLLEFFEVCFHSILFSRKIYPESIFTLKKKYNIPVHISLFPDLNQYISDVLMSVKYFLASNHLKQLSLLILDSSLNPIEKFVFNNFYFDPSKLTRPMQQSEVHIIELQRIFRSFLLKLSTSDRTLKPTQHNSSFKIYVKIDEQTFMNTSGETNFEKFPWIAQDNLQDHNLKKVFPLQTIKTTFCHFEIFVEL